MEDKKDYEELVARLAEQDEILRALRNNEVDAVVGAKNVLLLRIKDAEDALKKQSSHLEELLRELRKAHDELELRVRERTAELERRNQELQDFAFVASHDLNEPLRKIQTFGSLLEEKSAGLLDDQSRNYVSRMTWAAGRMRELLDGLLRYSRADAKVQEPKLLKLDDIMRTVATDLEDLMQMTGARLEIGPLPVVYGDPYQLRQLFQNLVENALKYQRSEVKSIIRCYADQNNSNCRIYVEDNGIGFDEKYLEKIFKPFRRLHGKNEFAGTGIGLAICRKIMDRHGGTITANSTPGKGSTFIISLPLKQSNSSYKKTKPAFPENSPGETGYQIVVGGRTSSRPAR